jgi:DNA helicase II / ATP-dependent DNA helicase PcrA
MSEILQGLNDSQKKAVTAVDGPLLVLAGPGTGKTLVIVRRIAHLMERGVRPDAIAAVTFTNRAAREMRERIHALRGYDSAGMFVGTFHLLGLKIIRENISGYRVVCDRVEQVRILKGLLGNSTRRAEKAAGQISSVKNLVHEPDTDLQEILEAYDKALETEGAYDFDDLIAVPIKLLTENTIAEKYRLALEGILIDEYQDISPAQYKLLRLLLGKRANICAVGDPDQAIYGFRGADVQNFLNFQKDFAGSSVVILKDNYRSSGAIVRASNALISHNRTRMDKVLQALRDRGPRVTVVSVPDERGEADVVIREIEARIGGTSHYSLMTGASNKDFEDSSCGFGDFAVLFRTKAQANIMAETLSRAGIPVLVVGDDDSSRRKEVVQRLREYSIMYADGSHDLAELLRRLCEEIDVSASDRLFLEQLEYAYGQMAPQEAIVNIINELSLATTADAFNPRGDAVALVTLHAAKGLEFRTVFIAGVEDGLIPHGYSEENLETEEERRLFYVGMTRAKDDLFLLLARVRRSQGRQVVREPSRFLKEIPQDLVLERVVPDRPKKAEEGRQLKLF